MWYVLVDAGNLAVLLVTRVALSQLLEEQVELESVRVEDASAMWRISRRVLVSQQTFAEKVHMSEREVYDLEVCKI